MDGSGSNAPAVSAPRADQDLRPTKRWTLWLGRILSALPIIAMALSAVPKVTHSAGVVQGFTTKFGYPETTLTGIGILELACAVLYAIPRTAVLGAILVTAYFGGAVATHIRISDPSFIAPAVLGVLAWVGLYLRDRRLHELLPLRKLQ